MQVILTKEVLGLGDPGDVVTVKNGYGRNYLLPQGMAMLASDKNVQALEAERKRIAAQQASEADRVRADADNLAGISITLKARAGDSGKLFGSVTNMDIAKELAELGHDIDRRRILLDQPIKQLGESQVDVKLHPQVVVQISVTVEAEIDEEALAAQAAQAAKAAEADEAEETVEDAGDSETEEAEGETADDASPAEEEEEA